MNHTTMQVLDARGVVVAEFHFPPSVVGAVFTTDQGVKLNDRFIGYPMNGGTVRVVDDAE